MKGLLYKDFLMAGKYCWSYLLLVAIFTVVLVVEPGNLFYMIYPCLFVGVIPMTVMSYDERDKWIQFSAALPVGRGMLVSAKYLVGLLCQMTVLAVSAVAYYAGLCRAGMFNAGEYFSLLAMLLSFSLLIPALLLPFIFKLGVEKGRTAYYVAMGVTGGFVAVGAYFEYDFGWALTIPNWGVGGIFGLCAAVYAASWLLSVRFYQKREL